MWAGPAAGRGLSVMTQERPLGIPGSVSSTNHGKFPNPNLVDLFCRWLSWLTEEEEEEVIRRASLVWGLSPPGGGGGG